MIEHYYSISEREFWQPDRHIKTVRYMNEKLLQEGKIINHGNSWCWEDDNGSGIIDINNYFSKLYVFDILCISDDQDYEVLDFVKEWMFTRLRKNKLYRNLEPSDKKIIKTLINSINEELVKCIDGPVV